MRVIFLHPKIRLTEKNKEQNSVRQCAASVILNHINHAPILKFYIILKTLLTPKLPQRCMNDIDHILQM